MKTLNPEDKAQLRDVLWLSNFSDCELAVRIWSDYRKHVMKDCGACPCADARTDLACGKCLELTLRRYEALAPDDIERESARLHAMHGPMHFGNSRSLT